MPETARTAHPTRRQGDREFAREPGGEGHGTLIIIGGNEDKAGDRLILSEVASHVRGGSLLVATVASSVPEENWALYRRIFGELGIRSVQHLEIPNRGAAFRNDALAMLAGADVVFFTGGDQGQLAARLAGTPVHDGVVELFASGGCIAGTSAGAAAMSETVITSNLVAENHSDVASFTTVAGLGLLRGVLIDQHFAQRGRMSRLLAAVARNPALFGIGIDEDTGIVVQSGILSVIGAGSVYLVDAHCMTATNSEARDGALSVYDMRVHVLNGTDKFNLRTRRPASRDGSR